METKYRKDLLASHAMWARDYEGALKFYTEYLQLEEHLDALSSYRVYFDLVVLSTILRKPQLADLYRGKLQLFFEYMKETRYSMRKKTGLSIEGMWSKIARETDPRKMEALLAEYFPEEKDLLGLFMSPRYALGFLRAVVRNVELSRPPPVFEEGIFKYTLDSELYRVIGKAYSIDELELERFSESELVNVLIKNPTVYYVENAKLNIIAGIQREGLVLCQYFLRNSKDMEGFNQIHDFLRIISEVLSKPQ